VLRGASARATVHGQLRKVIEYDGLITGGVHGVPSDHSRWSELDNDINSPHAGSEPTSGNADFLLLFSL